MIPFGVGLVAVKSVGKGQAGASSIVTSLINIIPELLKSVIVGGTLNAIYITPVPVNNAVLSS